MRKKTVEVPPTDDIDKIVRRCRAETEEGLKRRRRGTRGNAETHLVQYTDIVVIVPVAKQYFLLKTPDHVAQMLQRRGRDH